MAQARIAVSEASKALAEREAQLQATLRKLDTVLAPSAYSPGRLFPKPEATGGRAKAPILTTRLKAEIDAAVASL